METLACGVLQLHALPYQSVSAEQGLVGAEPLVAATGQLPTGAQ